MQQIFVQVWMVYILAFCLGMVNVFDNPTRQTFYIELVGSDNLRNAVTLYSTLVNLSAHHRTRYRRFDHCSLWACSLFYHQRDFLRGSGDYVSYDERQRIDRPRRQCHAPKVKSRRASSM